MQVHMSLMREDHPTGALSGPGAMIPVGSDGAVTGAPVQLPHATLPGGSCLRFALSVAPPETTGNLLNMAVADIPDGPVLMRLDQVTFPPGAVAYRHVHAGPGIRYLDKGELHLHADDHAFVSKVGDSWYEAAQSPVRAEASTDHPETRFIRFMALPPDYAGQPTIRILDAEDAARPKRQSTHRFFEQVVHLDAG